MNLKKKSVFVKTGWFLLKGKMIFHNQSAVSKKYLFL